MMRKYQVRFRGRERSDVTDQLPPYPTTMTSRSAPRRTPPPSPPACPPVGDRPAEPEFYQLAKQKDISYTIN